MKSNKKLGLLPRNIQELIVPTNNIYESTVIITNRAKQIAMNMKQELSKKLEAFVSISDERDPIDLHRQSEITQQYEKLPKPTLAATKEFLAGELTFHY